MEKEIMINDVAYIEKSMVTAKAEDLNGMPYVVVRCNRASTCAGYLKERQGQEVTLLQGRRLWYWDGAASLSQLAMEGVKRPANCKFPCEVEEILLLDAIEIMPATEAARLSIAGAPEWREG